MITNNKTNDLFKQKVCKMNELKIDKNNNEYSVFNKIKAPRRESRTYTEVF